MVATIGFSRSEGARAAEAVAVRGILEDFPPESAGPWHVLHTKSRQEKALAADLASMSIAYFLPLVRTVRPQGGRRVELDLPLFPSYLFLRGDLDQVYRADRTKRIANIIRVVAQQELGNELENLAMALAQRAPLEPHPYLVKGMRVEVTAGPLRGIRGVISGRASNRLVLQVDLLGQAVSVEIDGSLLEPVRG